MVYYSDDDLTNGTLLIPTVLMKVLAEFVEFGTHNGVLTSEHRIHYLFLLSESEQNRLRAKYPAYILSRSKATSITPVHFFLQSFDSPHEASKTFKELN